MKSWFSTRGEASIRFFPTRGEASIRFFPTCGKNRPSLFDEPADTIPEGIHMARVISVYDGDTITIAMVHENVLFKYNVRLNGIDTPELKYPGLNKDTENDNSPQIAELKEKRAKGILARDRLRQMIAECPRQIVFVECKGREKYGRLLADVYPAEVTGCFFKNYTAGNATFASRLIAEGHGIPYFGGKR